MASYYDDNFGHYEDMDDEENIQFYKDVQKQSVLKTCRGCERKVRFDAALRPL